MTDKSILFEREGHLRSLLEGVSSEARDRAKATGPAQGMSVCILFPKSKFHDINADQSKDPKK